jgi:hypothetical protein
MWYIYSYSINCSQARTLGNKRRAENCMFQAPCTRIGFTVSSCPCGGRVQKNFKEREVLGFYKTTLNSVILWKYNK